MATMREYDALQKAVVYRYAAGLPLAALAALVATAVGVLAQHQAYVRSEGAKFDKELADSGAIRGEERHNFGFAALALMLLPARESVTQLAALVSTYPDVRSYLFDVQMKAFLPEFALEKNTRRINIWSPGAIRCCARSPSRKTNGQRRSPIA